MAISKEECDELFESLRLGADRSKLINKLINSLGPEFKKPHGNCNLMKVIPKHKRDGD